jgi:CRISPR-associated protein Csm2
MSYGDRGQRGPAPAAGATSLDSVKKIITTDDPKLLVEQAQQIGRQVAEAKLTTSQIRNVYGPVRQIEMTWPELTEHSTEEDRRLAGKAYREVILLKPKLVYLAAREPKLAALEQYFGAAIDEIGNAKDEHERRIRFKRFVEFFEAILAYHRK